MIQIRKILCPVDQSECSRHALDHAIAVARWYEASVTVLQVYEAAPAAAVAPVIPATDLKLVDPEQLLAALRRFVAVAHAAPGIVVEVLVRDGETVREILEQADAMPADLLVLGTHGRSGFQRLVLGSVTEKVLRRARCPVLSIPPRAEGLAVAPVAYKRILCPVDFSDSSMEALRFATSLAKEADARLTVLHVMEYDLHEAADLYDEFMANQRLSVADFRARQQLLSRERLETAVSNDVRMYCSVETAVTDGKPYREILRAAAERASDLIVMGVRGRAALDRLLFGSTTQHVVRMAGCPVLTLRE